MLAAHRCPKPAERNVSLVKRGLFCDTVVSQIMRQGIPIDQVSVLNTAEDIPQLLDRPKKADDEIESFFIQLLYKVMREPPIKKGDISQERTHFKSFHSMVHIYSINVGVVFDNIVRVGSYECTYYCMRKAPS